MEKYLTKYLLSAILELDTVMLFEVWGAEPCPIIIRVRAWGISLGKAKLLDQYELEEEKEVSSPNRANFQGVSFGKFHSCS
jgi:hypothetical protein